MTVDKTRHQSGKYNHNVVPTAMATLIQIGKANLLFQEKVSTPKHFQWVWLDTLSKWLYPGLITAAVYRGSLCLQLSAQDVCESCHLILTGSCHLILTGSGKSWSATHKNITTLPPPSHVQKQNQSSPQVHKYNSPQPLELIMELYTQIRFFLFMKTAFLWHLLKMFAS